MTERINEIIVSWKDDKNDMPPAPLASADSMAGNGVSFADGRFMYFMKDRIRVFEKMGDPEVFTDHFAGETFNLQVIEKDGHTTTFTYQVK